MLPKSVTHDGAHSLSTMRERGGGGEGAVEGKIHSFGYTEGDGVMPSRGETARGGGGGGGRDAQEGGGAGLDTQKGMG